MRRPVILLAALTAVLALTGPALAVPPSPNHRVVQVLGRHLFRIDHNGDVTQGSAQCSGQGETVDVGPNFDGTADGLRGRVACLENDRVTRFRFYWIRLEVFHAGTWQPVAIDDEDFVSANNPASIADYTPVPGFCSDIVLTYRVRSVVGIRWTDGTLGLHAVNSNQFQARAAVNTQVCG
jgi:hypothetical protein